MDDTKKGISDIKEIIFVGGSTRIPKIKELIRNYFFDVHINDSINPDETVGYSAAIQTAKLMKQGNDILNNVILMDITPFFLSVGVINKDKNLEIRNKGDLMIVIIPRGTKIPVKLTNNYITAYDNQERVLIEVFEKKENMLKIIIIGLV